MVDEPTMIVVQADDMRSDSPELVRRMRRAIYGRNPLRRFFRRPRKMKTLYHGVPRCMESRCDLPDCALIYSHYHRDTLDGDEVVKT